MCQISSAMCACERGNNESLPCPYRFFAIQGFLRQPKNERQKGSVCNFLLFSKLTTRFHINNGYLTQINVCVDKRNRWLLSELLWMGIVRREQPIGFMNLRLVLFNDRSKPGIGLARLLYTTITLKRSEPHKTKQLLHRITLR